jgi:hypothetical protein
MLQVLSFEPMRWANPIAITKSLSLNLCPTEAVLVLPNLQICVLDDSVRDANSR